VSAGEMGEGSRLLEGEELAEAWANFRKAITKA
jgi:hypothetical protein